LDAELDFSRNFCACELDQVLASSDFESTSAWNDSLVLNGVLHGTQTVTDGVLRLSDRVVIGSLDKNRARERIINTFNERVFIVSETLLVDQFRETEIGLLNIIDGVELFATACQRDSLTVSTLGTSDADDVVPGEDLE